MTTRLQQQSITLVANVAQDIVWTGAHFTASVGHAVIRKPFYAAVEVQNTTAQVCYVTMRYQTEIGAVAVLGGARIGSIGAGQTATIPIQTQIGPDVQSITVSVQSQAAGVVRVSLVLDERAPAKTGELIGPSEIQAQDYIPIQFFGSPTNILPNGTVMFLYTVPAGKRAIVDVYSAYLFPVPNRYAAYSVLAQFGPANLDLIVSLPDMTARSAFTNLVYLRPGDSIAITWFIDADYATSTPVLGRVTMRGRELF